uniref:Aminotransferase-like plant mobile domain-containing protein n=1 Tax=Fagus sylvatica TaxID=28930 RepID=A0A2N9GB89_FAGSY
MVSLKDGNITRRIGRFLKPCVRYSNQAAKVPNVPLLSEFFSYYNQAWNSKVHFKGWKQHLKRWDEWIDKLAGKYGYKWNQTGICDAIMSSRYEIHCNRDLVLGLVEFWCAETNTFVFPWGEATITLEDVMILGGFPILGEEVTSSLSVELVEIEEEMKKLKKEFSRSKSRRANYGAWINYFMENENENEFEHVAFLSLWLSRHVFPSLPDDINNGLKPLQPGEPRVAQWANGTNLNQHSVSQALSGVYSSLQKISSGALMLLVWKIGAICHITKKMNNWFHYEKYMPHQVAMQFGMDQHLPGEFSDVNFAEENVHFFIPPRSFHPGVSATYFSWWKECVLAQKDAIKEVLLKQEYSTKNNGRASSASKSPKKHGNESPQVAKTSTNKKSNASCAYMFNSGIAKPKLEQIEEDVLSNPKFAQSSITNRKMKSEILQSFGSEKNEVKCHIPTAVKNQENSQKSGQESYAAVSPNMFEISSEDESLDDVPISEIFKRRDNVAKRSSTSEDYTYKQPENVVTPTSSNGAANEAHSEASESGNDLLDTAGLSKGIKQQNGSAKSGDEEGKKQKTGGSFYNQIDVDDYMQTIGSKSQNLGLVERIRKLEKLLGLKPK